MNFLGQKVSKMRLFKFCEKSMHGTFLKSQQHTGLKLTRIIFLRKILHWGFWIKSGPKLVFKTNWCFKFLWFLSYISMKLLWLWVIFFVVFSLFFVLFLFLFLFFWEKILFWVLSVSWNYDFHVLDFLN